MTSARRVLGLLVLALFPVALGAGLYALRISCFYWVQLVFALATGLNLVILTHEKRPVASRTTAIAGVTAVMTFLAFCLASVRLLIG